MTALSTPSQSVASWTRPTRLSASIFAAKAAVFRARRGVSDLVGGPPRLARIADPDLAHVIAESRTPLWSDEALTERAFQLGKVQNLRVACRSLDGLVIPAGAAFSLWRHLGPPTRARGYVTGRMLQQGCLTPAVGGGLCQLSNALYEAALQAGCRIVERHPHSRLVPGSAAALGRDATVAWNYVDLRFAADRPLRLSARVERGDLVVRLLGQTAGAPSSEVPAGLISARDIGLPDARSCGSCNEIDCFRHEGGDRAAPAPASRQVFLVDEAWPEFQDHVRQARQPGDGLGLPLGGGLFGSRYDWPTDGFSETASAPTAALLRTQAVRRAGPQGAARRSAELAAASRIAASLARLLTAEVTEVTLAQSYLPHLWRQGHLGGRSYSVLMTRLPMGVLQARLDTAAAAHPERASLADFRAPAWLVEAEAEALAGADRIITPHAEIAALFGERALQLEWSLPPARLSEASPRRLIAFAGPTVARKGAYAVREAAIALDLEVMPLGAELEGPDFWRGVATVPAGPLYTGLGDGVAAVVQPALVEDQPRRLLAALAAGVPVIASPACGLGPRPGLTLVPPDDPAALIAALELLTRPVYSAATAGAVSG
jgi:hypothetical protein